LPPGLASIQIDQAVVTEATKRGLRPTALPDITARARHTFRLVNGVLPDDTTHTGEDLKSGVGGGSLQEGFASLLAFLEAAAESYRYQFHTGRQGENVDLFPAEVIAWAYQHSDEIGMLRWAIEESGRPLIEESGVVA
jgi:hypothetical protein